MSVSLIPCASTGEIGDALNRALDHLDQALALAASVRDGIAPDVRIGEHEWKLGLLSARAASLTGLCALIDADDVALGLDGISRDVRPAQPSAAA